MLHPVFYLEKKKAFKLTTEDIIQLFYKAVEKWERRPLGTGERLLKLHNWKSICYVYGSNLGYYFLSSQTCRIQDCSWDYLSSTKCDIVDVLIYLGDGEDLGTL